MKDKIVNWAIVKVLFLAWLGSLLAAITLKLSMFRIILPVIIIGILLYIAACTVTWFLNTDFEDEDKKVQDKDNQKSPS